MLIAAEIVKLADKSLPSRGAWIEILLRLISAIRKIASLPSRGAWIEIYVLLQVKLMKTVAPLAGGVD